MLEERINLAISELKKEEPTREAFDPDHKKEIAEPILSLETTS